MKWVEVKGVAVLHGDEEFARVVGHAVGGAGWWSKQPGVHATPRAPLQIIRHLRRRGGAVRARVTKRIYQFEFTHKAASGAFHNQRHTSNSNNKKKNRTVFKTNFAHRFRV